MQTRSQYPLFPLLEKVEQNHSLEKVEQKHSLEKVEQNHSLEKVEKMEQKGLAQPFSKVEGLAQPLLKVEVDFDEASKAWKANKKSIGNGCYKYICTKITKTGKQCKTDSLCGREYCKFHVNK